MLALLLFVVGHLGPSIGKEPHTLDLLLIPLSLCFGALLFVQALTTFISGEMIKRVSRIMVFSSCAVAALLLLVKIYPAAGEYLTLVIIAVAAWSVYATAEPWIRETVVAQTVYRLLFLPAFILVAKILLELIQPEGVSFPVHGKVLILDLSGIAVNAFVITILVSLLSLLRLSPNPAISSLGALCGGPPLTYYALFFSLITYYKVKAYLIIDVPGLFYMELTAVFLLLVWLFSRFKKNISSYVHDPETPARLARHVSEIRELGGAELKKVSASIEQFLVKGKRDELLHFLAMEAARAHIDVERFGKMISPLLNYAEKRPLFITAWDNHHLEFKNRKRRRQVFEETLELYGKIFEI